MSLTQVILGIVAALIGAGIFFSGQKNGNAGRILTGIGLLIVAGILFFLSWKGVIFMLLLGAGLMLFVLYEGSRKKNHLVVGIACIAIAILTLIVWPGSGTDAEDVQKTYEAWEFVEGEYLGKYVKEHYPDKKVCVLYTSANKDHCGNFMTAFEKGYGASVDASQTLEVAPLIPPEGKKRGGMLHQRDLHRASLSAAKYMELVENAQGEILLNLAGLPPFDGELEKFEFFSGKTDKVMILPCLDTPISVFWPVIKGAKNKAVGAFVTMNLERKPPTKISGSLDEAFDSRYILINPENVASYMANPKYSLQFAIPEETETDHEE